MSAVIRTRRNNKHRSLSTTALWLVLGLAVLFFIVRYGQELLLEHSLNDQVAVQRVQNAALRDDNSRLAAKLQYYLSDKYIEQRAREDLNLRRPDEQVLIPINAAPSASQGTITGVPSAQQPITETTVPPAEANWQKWLDLFSSGSASP
ncbi:MAG: septum formation initiator family protein [Chloroflexi bacterium]|nr:septum formation initiator family protein [Chloroflexota bacterium]